MTVLAVFAALAGCSPDRKGLPELAEVQGTVTLDGSALGDAVVEFVPLEAGRNCSGKTTSSGQYRLAFTSDVAGAPPGEYQVRITSFFAKKEYNEKGIEIPFVEKIPAKYNSKTTLTASVKSGKNEINFELLSK
ncbi:carboxypeptidase-like regulatory domain-containing protein [Planctomicrobium piriforme]|uniref:carboxypeptidase-like regulatory domain-containing protein n=1 Tax=Planctomicrobium piriforme TaxID=1576369 RepID=UPI001113C267|nr:carboxypeptidase-like regulatory domain-containing protein [Planctomicrobium piriforme]